jgi:hypothetical protein
MLKPKPVTSIDIAFGPKNVNDYMPVYSSIPDEFKNGRTWGNKMFNKLFFEGGSVAELVPKEGINKEEAVRHIGAVMGSFQPKHEHKEAAVAYMFVSWFETPTT